MANEDTTNDISTFDPCITPYLTQDGPAQSHQADMQETLRKDFTVANLRERIVETQKTSSSAVTSHLYQTIFKPNPQPLRWPSSHLLQAITSARNSTFLSHSHLPKPSYIEAINQLNNQLNSTIHELKPQLLLAAYRIIRIHGQLKGLFSPLEPLTSALYPNFNNPNSLSFNGCPADPYIAPSTTNIMAIYRQNLDLPYPLIQALIEANNLPEKEFPEFQHLTSTGFIHAKAPGLPLAPPPPPSYNYSTANPPTLSSDYDPGQDPALTHFIKLITEIAHFINLYDGSIQAPQYGSVAMELFSDPYLIRLAWPSKAEIVEFEKILLKDVADIIIMTAITESDSRITEKYGTTTDEAYGLFKLARTMLREHYSYNTEDAKAIISAKLDLIASKNDLDPRVALIANKQIAAIHGLGRDSTNDSFGSLLSAFNQSKDILEDDSDLLNE